MAPELSVVIATRDRRERLRACLESLARQTAPADAFEVVVCVDGSADGTEEMLRELSTPYALRMVVQAQGGQSKALNRAVEVASAKHLLVLDDDMVASPDLVQAHLEAQRGGEEIAGIGRIERRLPERPDRLARKRAEDWRAHYESLSRRPATLRDAYSGNLSLPTATFHRAGGFADDVLYEQDIEFSLRLHELGAGFRYVPRAVATEHSADDWRRIIRQETERGRVAVELYRRRPSILPWIELGGRAEHGRKAAALRSLLLSLRIAPRSVARAAMLVPARSERALDFAYHFAYWSGVRRAADRDTWRRLRRGVTILMYHGVGPDGERPSRYVVPVRRLGRQLAWLARRRYNVISLDEYLRLRAEFRLPAPRSVVITFDDGYRDNLELAFPMLERLGLPATVFLVSSGLDQNTWSTTEGVAARPLMSLDEARGILGGVVSFGAHSRTHPRLPELPAPEAEREVVGSRAELEQALGVPITTFAYPYGGMSPEIRAFAEQAGYACACSVVSGRNRPSTDPFALRRIEVRGTDSLPRFALTMWLGEIRWRR